MSDFWIQAIGFVGAALFSNYDETNKQNMKNELEILKEAISKEIELRFQRSSQ